MNEEDRKKHNKSVFKVNVNPDLKLLLMSPMDFIIYIKLSNLLGSGKDLLKLKQMKKNLE